MREKVIKRIEEEKVIAIVRGVKTEQLLKVAQALYDGGIQLMEVTYDQKKPESWEATAFAIGDIACAFEGKMLVGAGTVTCTELVELTAEHGGLFAISPDTNTDVIRRTVELGLVSIPGAITPSEIMTAHYAGADFIKIFPAGEFGAGYLKAICGPINHVKLMAVGGVGEKNAREFIAAGACGIGVGGNLANRTWIENGEFHRITEAAAALVAAVKGY